MAYYPNNPNGQTTSANSAPVVIASDQSPVSINVSTDVFEHLVVGSRYNQIEVNFSQTDPDLITDITVTKTNGGDASNSSGQAVFTTGTNTNGGIKAVSNGIVTYNPHFETFAAFSAIFTTGIANSYQRIGIYDANNGFFIGYNNTTFGCTLRKGGLDTFTGQGSFNIDTLTGAPTSNYKRNGVPEAVDFTKDNLYRIRFGWLGAAPITFEIYSPDGDWVAFNIIKHPNTSASASIDNPDLPLTLDAQKTAAGVTALVMSTGCWGAGTTSDLKKLSDAVTDGTLAKTVKSIIAAKDGGGNYINIGATLSGNLETAISEVAAGVTFPITDNGGSITIDGSVSVSNFPANQVVSGTVAATQSGTWNVGINSGSNSIGFINNTSFGVTQATAANLNATVVGTGTFAVQAAQSGTWNINNISGTISLPTGASTETTLSSLNGKVPSGLTVTSTRLLVDGSGVTQPISGSVSVSNFPATQPVSGTVSVNLNAGTNYVGKVRLTDGTTDAEVVPLAGFNAQAVAIVDGSGSQITSFGGGTQYANGAAIATPTGTVALGFDGTNVQALSTNINGVLQTDIINSVTVTTALDPTVYNTGAILSTPFSGLMVLADGSGSAQALQLDPSSNLKVISAANPGVDIGNVVATGNIAHDSPDSGDPVKIGFKADATTTLAGAVANNDRVDGVADRYGRQLVAQIDPSMQVWRAVEYTSAQTGTNIWVPTAGNRFVVTQINITTGGTTAGLVTIWGAQTATTTYTAGTDQAFFRGVITPTANATPGALIQPPHPMFSDTTNDCLKITTSAAMTIYIQVYGYEITP